MIQETVYETIYQDTLKRYKHRFEELGESPRALGWGCREDQLERFEVMCENYDFNGKIIMDIGCGFADFYAYLLLKEITCQYIGVDIIPEFIDCCKEKFPKADFIEANVMMESNKLPETDVVVTNGTLNFKQSIIDNLVYTEEFIKVAFKKAKKVLIMDFLSTQLVSDYPKETQVYYHDPKDILELAFKYTDDLKLVHNYKAIPQKEFMLFMYKK